MISIENTISMANLSGEIEPLKWEHIKRRKDGMLQGKA